MEQNTEQQIDLDINDTLSINTLIEKAEQLAYDGKINNAAIGTIPVQILLVDGRPYVFSVRMEMVEFANESPEPESNN
jgi:hypothetical protein